MTIKLIILFTLINLHLFAQVPDLTVNNATNCDMTVYAYSEDSGCTIWSATVTCVSANSTGTLITGNGNAGYNWSFTQVIAECGANQCADILTAGWTPNCNSYATTDSYGVPTRACNCVGAVNIDCNTPNLLDIFP